MPLAIHREADSIQLPAGRRLPPLNLLKLLNRNRVDPPEAARLTEYYAAFPASCQSICPPPARSRAPKGRRTPFAIHRRDELPDARLTRRTLRSRRFDVVFRRPAPSRLSL